MRFRTTGILVLLFAAFVGYIYLFEIRGANERKRAEEEARRVLQVGDEEQVTGLTVRSRDTTIVMVKEGGVWRIHEPLETDGDAGEIGAAVGSLRRMDRGRVVADSSELAEGRASLAEFGLDAPDVVVVLAQADGRVDTLYWGDESPTGKYAYLRLSGSPEVVGVNAWLKRNVDKGLFKFRDKRVIPFDRHEIRKIEIAHGGERIVVLKQDGEWRMLEPVADRGDAAEIERLLNRLHAARLKRFVEEAPEDLAPYGLDAPTVTVSLYEGEGLGKKTVTVGRRAEMTRFPPYFATCSSRTPVFTVDSTFVVDVRQSASDLRDKQVFEFDPGGVDRLVLVFPDSTVEVRRDTTGPDWTALQPPLHVALEAEVSRLLNYVRRLKAKRYVAESLASPEAYGLDRPALVASFWRGKELVQKVAVGKVGERAYAVGHTRPQLVEIEPRDLAPVKLDLVPVVPDKVSPDTVRFEAPGGSEE